MPTPTEKNTERIEELVRLVSELTRRADKIESDASWASEWVEKLRAADEELRLKIHAMTRDVEELRKAREEWGRRGWGIVQALVGVVVGGLITYLVRR